MQRKEVQVVFGQDGRAPIPEAARTHLRERSSRKRFVADLPSIISAAHELPAEVDPPARVWASLHAQLAAEGTLRRSVRGRLQKRTRLPRLRKIRERPEEAPFRQGEATCRTSAEMLEAALC